MATVFRCFIIFLFACYAKCDDIDLGRRNGVMLKFLREMVNQTKADTLNLPANATSIRENIVDTFSCENRTYGYYADVDNECQVFHVCLTSQTQSGRNVTYRWSFICPNETIFNQEVLTCTRPRDSIPCEDSPMYYDVNMDIGKLPNDTQSSDNNQNTNSTQAETISTDKTKDKRQPNRRKQNIIVENLLKEVVNEELEVEEFGEKTVSVDLTNAEIDFAMDSKPQIHEVGEEYEMKNGVENERLATERSLKRRGRKIKRGSFRFKANV